MDPWLESQWGDLHHSIIQYSRDLIADQLPQGLFAAVEETVFIKDRQFDVGRVRPDVGVFRSNRPGGGRSDQAGGTMTANPVRFAIIDQPVIEGHIEIRKIGGGEPLITAIEVISPTNKSDARGRKMYLDQRESYFKSGANVVELDLLRAGEPIIFVPWERVHPEQLTPYRAAIGRGPAPEVEMEVEYCPLSLRERLPVLAIPLRSTDKDVVLDLQKPIDLAYEKGRYGMRIDYSKPPIPALSEQDAEWASKLITA